MFVPETENSFFREVLMEYWVPSLQHIAAVRTVQLLVTHQPYHDFFDSYIKQIQHWKEESTLQLEYPDYVSDRISEFPIPALIKSHLKYFVEKITRNCYYWINYQDEQVLNVRFPASSRMLYYSHHIVWTLRGDVDYAKTGKKLLEVCDTITPREKFKMACYYCLADEVRTRAPTSVSMAYAASIIMESSPPEYYFIRLLTHNLRDLEERARLYRLRYDLGEHLSYHTLLARHAALQDREFLKYMWDRFSNQEKKESDEVADAIDANLLCYFLRRSDQETVQTIVKMYKYIILRKLITDNLWLEFATPFIFQTWSAVDGDYFNIIMSTIDSRLRRNDNVVLHDRLASMLEQIWSAANENLKEYSFNHGMPMRILSSLYWDRSIDFVEKLLRSANELQRRNMIRSEDGINLSLSFLRKNQIEYLNLFVERCLSEPEEVERFKQTLGSQVRSLAPEFLERFQQWAL